MINEENHTVRTVQRSIEKLQKQSQINTPNKQKQTHWLSCFVTIKCGGVTLVVWAQTSPRSQIMRSYKCFPYVSKIPTFTRYRSNRVIIKMNSCNLSSSTLCIIYYIIVKTKIKWFEILQFSEKDTEYHQLKQIFLVNISKSLHMIDSWLLGIFCYW